MGGASKKKLDRQKRVGRNAGKSGLNPLARRVNLWNVRSKKKKNEVISEVSEAKKTAGIKNKTPKKQKNQRTKESNSERKR